MCNRDLIVLELFSAACGFCPNYESIGGRMSGEMVAEEEVWFEYFGTSYYWHAKLINAVMPFSSFPQTFRSFQ
jgi:hypothetical protein